MWLTDFWGKIPESVKKEIIDNIVEYFKKFFSAYYKSQKGESNV